jgi:iron complex outermembrane receptor protein
MKWAVRTLLFCDGRSEDDSPDAAKDADTMTRVLACTLGSLAPIHRVVVATVAMISAVVNTAAAQAVGSAANSSGLDEIVVTAQKRSENVQSIPLAVTALRAGDLQDRGLTDIADIAPLVPNLNVTQQTGRARITLRGIGIDNISTASESSVTLSEDGVFFARSAAALAGMFDVERVEVLRGPQGTLYGRNATAGSVNIITNQPSAGFEGYGAVTIGNYDTHNFEGAVGGPVSGEVFARIAFKTEDHSGYGKNLVTGHEIDDKNSQAVRGQVSIKPTDRLSILLGGDYYRSSDASAAWHYLGVSGESAPGVPIIPTGLRLPGGYRPSNLFDIASATDPKLKDEFYGGRVDATYQVNDAVSVRSLSAARQSDVDLLFNISPTGPTQLSVSRLTEFAPQFSEELQVNVNTEGNKVVAGLFLFDESVDGLTHTGLNKLLFGGPNLLVQGASKGGNLRTTAAAAYAQDTYSITPSLRLTVGGRYSWEKKSVNDHDNTNLVTPFSFSAAIDSPHRTARKTWDDFTPKLGLDYDLMADTLLYVSYAKGFKAGNYNLGNFVPPLGYKLGTQLPPVDPEKVTAYEAGLKTTLLHHRFRANIAGFYYDYTNLQVQKTQGTALVLENAASATIYGVEGEFEIQPLDTRGLLLTLTPAWLHARYDNFIDSDPSRPRQGTAIDPVTGQPAFDLRGAHLAQAPDYTVNLGAEYTFHLRTGALTIRGESFWSDRVYFSQFNRSETSQPAYNLLNASVSYESLKQGYYAEAYIKNIADKTIISGAFPGTLLTGGPLIGYLHPPRTFGVTVGIRF